MSAFTPTRSRQCYEPRMSRALLNEKPPRAHQVRHEVFRVWLKGATLKLVHGATQTTR
jgi:hypothetical protein